MKQPRMTKTPLQSLALFMCLLILSIPFYTADVFAVITFQDVIVTGGDDREGFRKAIDETRIKVVIDSPNSQILPTFLEVMNDTRGVTRNSPGTTRFQQCTTSNPYECTARLPINDAKDKDTFIVCINLANVEGRMDFPLSCEAARPVAMQGGNQYSIFEGLLLDKQGPVVQEITAQPDSVSTGMVTLTTKVLDSTGTGQPGCVGLAKITFFKQDGSELGQNLTPAPPVTIACPVNTTEFHFDAELLVTGASTRICAVPEDAFGNRHPSHIAADGTLVTTGQNCINITRDNQPPEISNFIVKDSAGVDTLTFVPDRNVDVLVSAIVKTHTHRIGSVSATISSFNAGETSIDLSCAEKIPDVRDEQSTERLYECTKKTKLNPAGEKTRDLALSAEDAAGNHADATTSITFDIDNVAPVVSRVTTSRVFNGAPVLGPDNNTLVVVIAESGAGISNTTVTFNNQPFKNCEKQEAGTFLCTAPFEPPRDADTARVTVDGRDLADNPLQPLTSSLAVDNTPPAFVRAQIISPASTPVLPQGGSAILRLIVSEDIAMVDDAGATRAFAQIPFDATSPNDIQRASHCQPYAPPQQPAAPASAFTPSPADTPETGPTYPSGATGALVAITGRQVQGENLWQCDWEILNLGSVQNMAVSFSGTMDLAGNLLPDDTIPKPPPLFMVYTDSLGRIHELHPDDWLGKTVTEGLAAVEYALQPVRLSPVVDARGAAAASIGIWFDVKINNADGSPLNVNDPNAALPVSVDVTRCSGEDYEAGFFAQEATKVMFSVGDRGTAKMRFNLRPGTIPETKNKFVVDCEFAIMSQQGAQVSGVSKAIAQFEIPLGNVKDVSDSIWDTIIDHIGGFGDIRGPDGGLLYGGIPGINELMEWVDKLDKVVSVLLSICNIVQGLAALSSGLHILDSTLGVAFEGKAFLHPISVAIAAIYNIIDSVTTFFQGIYGEVACNILTCQITPAGGLLRSIGFNEPTLNPDALFNGKMNELSRELSALDPNRRTAAQWTMFTSPRESLWLSYLTLCIPGILENLKKRQAIECKYVSCLYNNVAQGLPKTTCDKIYNYEVCKIEVGEMAALIPFVHIHRQLAGAVKQLLTQPVTLFLLAGASACKYSSAASGSATASSFCGALYVPFRLLKVVNDIRIIVDTIRNFGESPDDACESVIDQVKADPRYEETLERRRSGQPSTVPVEQFGSTGPVLPAVPAAEAEVPISD